MSTLEIHRTTTDTDLDEILVPASADGDEFTEAPGMVILMAVNKNKAEDRRGRHIFANDRTISLRVEHDGTADVMTSTLRAGDTYSFGPFGTAYSRDGFTFGTYDPVTVKLTYLDVDGLHVCAVSVADMRA